MTPRPSTPPREDDLSHRLIRHGRVDSTNERALQAVAEGTARHGDVHLATEQMAGRGRLGRQWASPAGGGLYASLILLPEPPAPLPETLTVATGLAVAEALESLGVGGIRLRWPNDVLVRGAKIAGILVETRGLDPQAPHFVIGMGINVGQRDFPAEILRGRAVTSLGLLGIESDPDTVLDAVLGALGPRLEQAVAGDPAMAREFLDAAGLTDAPVRVHHGSESSTGILRAMDWKDGLSLEGPRGERLSVPLPFVRSVKTLS